MLARSLLQPTLRAATAAGRSPAGVAVSRFSSISTAGGARASTAAASAGLLQTTFLRRCFSRSLARRHEETAPNDPENVIDPDQIRPMHLCVSPVAAASRQGSA
jgi:hypothetical protein